MVSVLKSSGAVFEGGSKHRIRLSVGHTASASTSLRKHPLGASKKPVVWEETFEFAIGLPTDFLAVTCARAAKSSKPDAPETAIGALTIALAHLPQATPVTKWYELKSGGQSVAVLQLRLLYTLAYSIHRRDATSSLTIVPSQTAREFLRKELFKYARSNRIQYRFVDYFLVVGCATPFGPTAADRRAQVLERFPSVDRTDFALPSQLETFCFPNGIAISPHPRKPACFSFRLNNQTELHTDQTVAAVVCFWERTLVTRSTLAAVTGDEYESSTSPDETLESSRSFSRSAVHEEEMSVEEAARSRGGSGSRGSRLGAPSTGSGGTTADFHSAPPLTPSYRVMPPPFASHLSPPEQSRGNGGANGHSSHLSRSPSPSTPTHTASSSPEDDLVHVYVPRCFVLLSRLGFVPVYKDILVTLYQHYCTRPEEATAQLDRAFQLAPGLEVEPDCPVCSDPDLDLRTCDTAAAALAQHQASMPPLPRSIVEHLPPLTLAAPALAAATTSPSPPAAAATASAPATTTSSSRFHRMDLSGMSSNSRASGATSKSGRYVDQDHQPDISAFGSLPIPPTPVAANQTRTIATSPESSRAATYREDTASVKSSPQLRHSISIDASRARPSSSPTLSSVSRRRGASATVPASPICDTTSCCPCSCCTVRVDCRGLTLEQYVLYLVDEVPLPLPGATAVEIQVCCKRYRLNLPASELDFPQLEFALHHAEATPPSSSSPQTSLVQSHLGLLQVLDLEVVLLLLRCILSEMKLVFHSASVALLHSVTESLIQLCFPFQWSHIYIPLLPAELYGMLEAPVSFIVGIESRGLARVEEMLGVEAGRSAAQQNRNAEIDDRRGHATGRTEAPSSRGGSLGSEQDRAGNGSGASPPVHDLSSFAFVDLDRGVVDLAVPPPPFPTTAQRALIDAVRRVTHPRVFDHDDVGEDEPDASASARRRRARQRAARREEQSSEDEVSTDIPPSHVGANYHMHFHPTLTPREKHTDAATSPSASGRARQRNGGASASTSPRKEDPTYSASDSSDSPILSPSPPTSAQLRDSASPPPTFSSPDISTSPAPVTAAAATAAVSNPFLTTTASSSGVTVALAVDRGRIHDRALRVEFLQFLASLIANYRDFLFFVSGATPVFDTPSFLALKGSRSESLPFLSRFLETQIFRDFLDRHVEFPSYLQDYLLYINSHPDTCQEPTEVAQRLEVSQTARVFHVPPPAPLTEQQFAAMLESRAQFYARQLSLSGGGGGNSSPFIASRGWDARHLPVLGLLAPGALAPDLPLKRRPSLAGLAGASNSPAQSPIASPIVMPSPRLTPASASPRLNPTVGSPRLNAAASSHHVAPPPFRSAVFPHARVFSLRHVDPSSSSSVEVISLGKNPSTLNHTLLFSKMYDGLSGSLSDSAQGSRAHTPKKVSEELTPEARDILARQGGVVPIEMSAFMSLPPAATINLPTPEPPTPSPPAPATQRQSANTAASAAAAASPASNGGGASDPDLEERKSFVKNALTGSSSMDSFELARRRRASGPLCVTVPEVGSPRDVQAMPPLTRSHSTLTRGGGPPSCSSSAASGAARHPHRRQMSLNLMSKSDFEKKKHPTASRLGQVVANLMTPRTSTAAAAALHVDLGELSAVGELLALPEWRASLVALFGQDLRLDRDNAPHRQLATSAFLSLSLLFNIALEECNTDSDYQTALALLHYSGKIFNHPGVEVVGDPHQTGLAAAPRGGPPSSSEREYLRSVLKRQQLWRDAAFWAVAYRSEITHKIEHVSEPNSPVGGAAAAARTPTSVTTPPTPPHSADRESLVFELIAGLIYLQLSLGVGEELVRGCVSTSCDEFHLSNDKRQTLRVLVANIRRTTQGTTTTPQFEANYTPQTTNLRRASGALESPISSLTLQYPRADAD